MRAAREEPSPLGKLRGEGPSPIGAAQEEPSPLGWSRRLALGVIYL